MKKYIYRVQALGLSCKSDLLQIHFLVIAPEGFDLDCLAALRTSKQYKIGLKHDFLYFTFFLLLKFMCPLVTKYIACEGAEAGS